MTALDIETAPILSWTWGLWNQNIGLNQIKEDPRIICFSYQEYGSKTVKFVSEYHDVPEGMTGQEWLLSELHRVLDEADIIVGWNSKEFDYKWIVGELQLAGFTAPSPVHHLDLMKHFRSNSKLPSKKLAYVSSRMLPQTKIAHDGFDMWRAIIDPVDPEETRRQWNKMRRYAKRDTALLFPIFEDLKSWITLPIPLHRSENEPSCPNCGSTSLQRRGFIYTRLSKFRRYQCNDCGKWLTGKHRVGETPEVR